LKAILHKRYDDVLSAVHKAESAFKENDEALLLLRASTQILRAFILIFLTQTFQTIQLKDLAKFLNLP